MERLTDFKPLRTVAIPGLGNVDCSGLILLVGPNSSGKSQFLQDLYRTLAGEPREWIVASEIKIEKPPLQPFLTCLENEGYFTTYENESGVKQLQPQTMYLGMGQPIQPIPTNNANNWYQDFIPDRPNSHLRQSQFLSHFGRLIVTALFLDRRLNALSATNTIDFQTQAPQHDLHALYHDDSARKLLNLEMVSSFDKAVWPDTSRGTYISLKVSDNSVLPTAEDRLSYKKMAEFRSIETEGDGMRSYLATCVSLLLGRRPVCLIDEPEMCLHPPQAYNLGKFIGKFGTSRECATFVATHSSHLLRGILQTAERIQIIRMTRRERKFFGHLVPALELTEALSRPTLRAESVLDGIFAQAVVIVEADGDRLVYQAVWETLRDDFKLDIHFSAVGGTSGIADSCGLYRTLNIPISIIADLDMLIDSDRMSQVLTKLIDNLVVRDAILKSCKDIAEDISKLPPTISPAEVKKALLEMADSNMDWSQSNDLELHRKIKHLANDIDRMRKLKKGGIAAFSGSLADKMEKVINQLKEHGLFLVPVGELEMWLSEHSIEVSKRKKAAWSNAAAQAVQTSGKRNDDVWRFVSDLGGYLSNQQNRITI